MYCVTVPGTEWTKNDDIKFVPQHVEEMMPNWITLKEEF